jgi:hypothetical protein
MSGKLVLHEVKEANAEGNVVTLSVEGTEVICEMPLFDDGLSVVRHLLSLQRVGGLFRLDGVDSIDKSEEYYYLCADSGITVKDVERGVFDWTVNVYLRGPGTKVEGSGNILLPQYRTGGGGLVR